VRVGCKCKCGVYTQDKLHVCVHESNIIYTCTRYCNTQYCRFRGSSASQHTALHMRRLNILVASSTHIFKLITKKLPGVQLRDYI
jgi:hypothetical protein